MAATATPTRSLNAAQREWLKSMGTALGAPVSDSNQAGIKGLSVKGIEPQDIPFDVIVDVTKTLLGPKKATCKLSNLTGRTLLFDESSLSQPKKQPEAGVFKTFPPKRLEAKDEFVGESTTVAGMTLTGSEGEVRYLLDDKGTTWSIRWNNPFASNPFRKEPTGNTADSKVQGPNAALFKKPAFRAGGSDDATFTYELELVSGPAPGPTPGPTPGAVDAASSCHITVTNDTKVVLTFGGSGHERGNFMTPPAKTLKPGDSTTFVSVETPNNQKPEDEGCKGHVLWQVGSPDVLWRIEWDNPERQQNVVSHSFNPPNPGFNSANFIGQGEENVPVTFTLSGAGGGPVPPPPSTAKKLSITVLELNGNKPIKDATVEITAGEQLKKSGKTGADGKVQFELPPITETTFVSARATAAGFDNEGRTFKLPEEGFEHEIHMKSASRVRTANFAVIDTNQHRELKGATVEVGGKSQTTDDRGRAEFELPPGQHPFLVKAEGFLENRGKVEMTSDKDEFVTVLMEAATGGKLFVAVSDAQTKAPIENANVNVAGKSAKTNKEGKADFELPAGEHAIQVTAEGFQENRVTASVKAGEKTDVAVFMQKGAEKPKFEPPPESKQPTLRKGAPKGDKWVEYLQKLLGFEGKDVDGDFGKKTHDAVVAFQTKKKLKIDGIVGNQTWAALRGAPPEDPSTDGRKPNTFVEKGQEARWFREKKEQVIRFENDTLKLKVVSVGDADVEGVKTRVRLTKVGGIEVIDDFPIGKAEEKLPEGGFLHTVSIPGMKAKFGAGPCDLRVEAFMPKDLGGDLFDDTVAIEIK